MSPSDWQAVWLSLKVAASCTALLIVPGIAVAWLLARRSFFGKSALEALVYAPLVLPPVVTGYLLLLLLGRSGFLGGWLYQYFGIGLSFHFSGAVLSAAVMAFPLLVRPIQLAFQWVDPRLETAAATLGAPPSKVFFKISLPLAMPGLMTGLLLAFIRSLGEFGATVIFAGNIAGETRTLPLALFTHLQRPGGESRVWMLTLIAVALSLTTLLIVELLAKRGYGRRR